MASTWYFFEPRDHSPPTGCAPDPYFLLLGLLRSHSTCIYSPQYPYHFLGRLCHDRLCAFQDREPLDTRLMNQASMLIPTLKLLPPWIVQIPTSCSLKNHLSVMRKYHTLLCEAPSTVNKEPWQQRNAMPFSYSCLRESIFTYFKSADLEMRLKGEGTT